MNVVYSDGDYYVTEPKNPDSSRHNIIDNHLWLIAKFMPNVSKLLLGVTIFIIM